MRRAFLYLAATTIRNRFRGRLKRLKQPRYSVALLLGALYFWFFLFRGGFQSGRAPVSFWSSAETVAALGVFVLLLGAWVFSGEHGALAFSPAEVQFLLPAPVTRRELIGYKLFRAQIIIALNALIWVVLLRRGGSVLPAPLRLVGAWALFSNLSLHRLGAALVRTSVVEHGRTGLRRNLPAVIVGGAAAIALLLVIAEAVPALRGVTGARDFGERLEQVTSTRAAAALLFLPRVIVGPTFAQTSSQWLAAIGPALLLLVLQGLWVMQSDVAFEEAAVRASEERARRIESVRNRGRGPRVRSGKVKRTLPLSPTGDPAAAIIWKNTLLLMRTRRSGAIIGLALMAMLFSIPALERGGLDEHFLATACLAMAGLLLVLGSRVLHNDLRQDTDHLAALKTLPLSGASLVGAEVLSSALPIMGLQLALVTVAYVALLGDPSYAPVLWIRSVALALAPLVLFALATTTITIQNGAALLFPGWVRVGGQVTGGVEAMGQGILATALLLITFLVALFPASVGFSVTLWALANRGAFTWIAATLVATLLLLGESWWAIRRLGRAFEKTEP